MALEIRQREKAKPSREMAGLSSVMASVLASRGVNTKEALDTSLVKLLLPDDLPDIFVAAKIIADAVMKGDRILIAGDFDADGATATTVTMRALKGFGCENEQIDFILPDRMKHGYGLSPELIKDWVNDSNQGKAPDLIITVDNGVSAFAGVDYAHSIGTKVVITDHHLPGETLPDADALVNPNLDGCTFKSKAIAGVGVAFYVMVSTRMELIERNWFNERRPAPKMSKLLDLVAVGTIADVVELDENNRILVAAGLKMIQNETCVPGITALFRASAKNPKQAKSTDLGFSIGPRLNAAGRLENMRVGVQCLLTDDEDTASHIANDLDHINKHRQEIQQSMINQAEEDLALLGHIDDDGRPQKPKDWIVFNPEFHQGVIGIVAGRLKEKWARPTFVFAPADVGEAGKEGAKIKGSGRSVEGIHLRDLLVAMNTHEPGLMLTFGGHSMAAGVSILEKDLERFKQVFERCVLDLRANLPDEIAIVSDGPLRIRDMTVDLAKEMQSTLPWGTAFPEPIFDNRFEILNKIPLKDGKHWRLQMKPIVDGERMAPKDFIEGIWFGIGDKIPDTRYMHLAYRLDVNRFRGEENLQLMITGGREGSYRPTPEVSESKDQLSERPGREILQESIQDQQPKKRKRAVSASAIDDIPV